MLIKEFNYLLKLWVIMIHKLIFKQRINLRTTPTNPLFPFRQQGIYFMLPFAFTLLCLTKDSDKLFMSLQLFYSDCFLHNFLFYF